MVEIESREKRTVHVKLYTRTGTGILVGER